MLSNIKYDIRNTFYMGLDKLTNTPHEIKFELTYKCDKKCSFCFNQNVEKTTRELEAQQVISLLNKIQREGIKRIRFTGGEPLLRNDITEIINYAKNVGLIVKINTNGTRHELTEFIGSRCDEILLSFHELKDSKQIMYFAQNTKPALLNLNTIATKENIHNFKEFERIAGRIKPNCWYWTYPIPMNDELIDWIHIKMLAQNLGSSLLNCRGIRFPLCQLNSLEMQYIQGCRNCGPHDHLVVTPDGGLRICNSLSINIGNIEDNITNVWQSHPLVQNIKRKKMLPSKCLACTKLNQCLGGCRLSAYNHTGSLYGKHPLAVTK